MKKSLLFLVGTFLFAQMAFTQGQAKPEDTVVATVNGDKIMLSQLEEAYQQNLLFLSNKKVTRKKVLDDLINRQIGIQQARKNKLEQNPLVLSKIEDILYHAQISKDLEGELKKINVTDQDVKRYYEDNKEYRTAHILFRLRAQPADKEVEEALNSANKVYEDVTKTPDKFAEYANKYSQTAVAPTGGDLGFQPPTRLAPEYFEAIKGQKVSFITKPVRTQFGYHVIKVLGVKEFDKININLYKKIVYDIKRDEVLENYFKKLRQSADVKVISDKVN